MVKWRKPGLEASPGRSWPLQLFDNGVEAWCVITLAGMIHIFDQAYIRASAQCQPLGATIETAIEQCWSGVESTSASSG